MSDLHHDVTELLADRCRQHAMPGASLAWFHDGETHFAGYGQTDVNGGAQVDENTIFGIGSTSKTLTATAVMALVERGKLSLDDRVVKHLPDLPVLDEAARDTVTVGQLLDHTSGWVGDGAADTGWGEDALARAIPELLGKARQQAPPGTLFSYNNNAVAVAGLLVARLHGSSFEDAVRDLVLAPLGMTSTFYLVWDIANRPHAVGHAVTDGSVRPVPLWPTARFLGPAGGAFSSARDVVTYARFHLTGEVDGTAPISEESRLLMREQRSSCRSGVEGAGVSWLLGRRGDVQLIEHGGNLSNIMVSTFSMAPSHALAVSVMGNSVAGTLVGNAVRDFLLDRLVGAPAQPDPVDVEQPNLGDYVGTYAAGQWNLVVTSTGDGLEYGMKLTDVDELDEAVREVFESRRTKVRFIGTDLVGPADGTPTAVGDFVRDDAGRISFFRTGLRLASRLPDQR